MARPADLERRGKTLSRVTDYVLEHGLADLSLRPLASALGTSTRMLLYDFSSKEDLIMAVLSEARRREYALLAEYRQATDSSLADLIRAIWVWLTAPERAPFLQLFFEVYVQAMNHPDAYSARGRAMVTEWLEHFGAFGDSSDEQADPVFATMVIATMRGLILDRFATGDETRTDRALEHFAQLVDLDRGSR